MPNELEEHLLRETELLDQKENWKVENDDQASWALRKLAAIKKEEQRLVSQATKEIDRIKEWLELTTTTLNNEAEFFENHLEGYLRRLQEAGKAKKSYKLPTGVIQSRKLPDRLEVVDEQAFIAWAKENDRLDLLRTTPAASEIKAKLEPALTGEDIAGERVKVLNDDEVVPGVEYEVGGTKYSAKPTLDTGAQDESTNEAI